MNHERAIESPLPSSFSACSCWGCKLSAIFVLVRESFDQHYHALGVVRSSPHDWNFRIASFAAKGLQAPVIEHTWQPGFSTVREGTSSESRLHVVFCFVLGVCLKK